MKTNENLGGIIMGIMLRPDVILTMKAAGFYIWYESRELVKRFKGEA